MIDFLRDNRELIAAVASVLVAILGIVTALLKRNTSHTIRHETIVDAPSPLARRVTSDDLSPDVSVVGEFLCVKNDSFRRSQITGVTLGRGINGMVALVAAPLFGILAVGAWSRGEYGIAILLGVYALVGALVAPMMNVYLMTPQGSRRIAKSLFPGKANKMRKEILSWRSS
jgi:hypothetical protein